MNVLIHIEAAKQTKEFEFRPLEFRKRSLIALLSIHFVPSKFIFSQEQLQLFAQSAKYEALII
jgi:hypothetical protein